MAGKLKSVLKDTSLTLGILTVGILIFFFTYYIQNPIPVGVGLAAIPGDCGGPNGTPDGFVDLFDYGNLSRSFGLTSGQSGFNAACDFFVDSHNIIDLLDYGILAQNFGRIGASPTPLSTITPHPTSSADPIIMANSDIICTNMGSPSDSSCNHMRVSDLVVSNPPNLFIAVGDLCHEPTVGCWNNFYNPSYGRVKQITKPVPGNHEYYSGTAQYNSTTYFDYFNGVGVQNGIAGERGKGYYSYNLGNWHIIALNSQCSEVGGCGSGSQQYNWLEADLRSNTKPCTLAYYHIPVFSSGGRANSNGRDFNRLLYNYNAEIVLSGHDHIYERFAPQNPNGGLDQAHGIRQFIVGTGGANHTSIAQVVANSEVRNADTFGVLKLTLHSGSYEWKFLPVPGKTFTDSGSTNCH